MPKQTAEERRLKQRERQRRHRERLSYERKEAIRHKDRECRQKKQQQNPFVNWSEKEYDIFYPIYHNKLAVFRQEMMCKNQNFRRRLI